MGRFGRLHCRVHKFVIQKAPKHAKPDDVLDNGGPAGVLYELLVACFYYGFIAASIAEVPTHTLKNIPIFGIGYEYLADSLVAHILHPFRWWCLPLGLCDSRPPIWSPPRLLHRLPQLLWLDIRSRLHRVHPLKCGGANVRRLPSGPGHPAMACLCCFRPHYLVLLRDGRFR